MLFGTRAVKSRVDVSRWRTLGGGLSVEIQQNLMFPVCCRVCIFLVRKFSVSQNRFGLLLVCVFEYVFDFAFDFMAPLGLLASRQTLTIFVAADVCKP